MSSFFTWKLVAIALLFFLLRFPQTVSAEGPAELWGAVIGGLIGALLFVSVLKLIYLGVARAGSRARSAIAG